jgi:hypothetical protein
MTPQIQGPESVAQWFGEWPSFHDAEILTLHIDRERQGSFLRLLAFTTSDRTDEAGYLIREHEAVVEFEFAGIRSLRIDGEDADVQNVIGCLLVEQVGDGFRLSISPSYGIGGEIVVQDLRVRCSQRFNRRDRRLIRKINIGCASILAIVTQTRIVYFAEGHTTPAEPSAR